FVACPEPAAPSGIVAALACLLGAVARLRSSYRALSVECSRARTGRCHSGSVHIRLHRSRAASRRMNGRPVPASRLTRGLNLMSRTLAFRLAYSPRFSRMALDGLEREVNVATT